MCYATQVDTFKMGRVFHNRAKNPTTYWGPTTPPPVRTLDILETNSMKHTYVIDNS